MSVPPKKANPGCNRGPWTQRLSKHQAHSHLEVCSGLKQALECVEELLGATQPQSKVQKTCGPAELCNPTPAREAHVVWPYFGEVRGCPSPMHKAHRAVGTPVAHY